jgi:hypothetical protein
MATKNVLKDPFSERPLPAVHAALIEFQLVLSRRLTEFQLPDSQTAAIERAIERATILLELANAGHAPRLHLLRAHKSMVTTFGVMRLMHVKKKIDSQLFDYVRCRIDQIISCLEELKAVPREQWCSPPPEPPEARPSDVAARAESAPSVGADQTALSVATVAEGSAQASPPNGKGGSEPDTDLGVGS